MAIMEQSSKAQDRTLGVWFHLIQQGQIKLPRFQRFEAWDRGRVTSFLNTIINNLPVGVTLALEVAGPEKFQSRYIATADPELPGASSIKGTITQHLLDGQQRLTAFWRAMFNSYESETYFVYLPQFDRTDTPSDEMEVRCQPRWKNKAGNPMPRWADQPSKCLAEGFLPISLLRPGDISSEIDQWLLEAMKPLEPDDDEPDALAKYKAFSERREKLKSEIIKLRERVTHFNLPYLSLPASTAKDIALQVFINMNTNSKPLSLYDIIVAEVESVAQESLHYRASNLEAKCPHASRYSDVTDLILSTSALLQDQLPNNRGMIEMDKQVLLDNWPKLERGLEKMAGFLGGQGIFDQARLPTGAVLPVIAAAYDSIPDDGDFLAKAEKLLRSYLWSAVFTDRYENTAASRAYADFKAIKSLLALRDFTDADLPSVPVLNRKENPLADADSLMSAGWPKGVGIEARGILAVSTYFGALDFADEKNASYESLQNREYHHIFPNALLSEVGIESNLALNCALITWKTNRTIGRKDPLVYLQERINFADEKTISTRLKTHLIPYDRVASAHYEGLTGDQLKARLEKEFREFLSDRARLIANALSVLADGGRPSLESII